MLAQKYFKIVSVLMFSNGKRINSSIQNQTNNKLSHDIIGRSVVFIRCIHPVVQAWTAVKHNVLTCPSVLYQTVSSHLPRADERQDLG